MCGFRPTLLSFASESRLFIQAHFCQPGATSVFRPVLIHFVGNPRSSSDEDQRPCFRNSHTNLDVDPRHVWRGARVSRSAPTPRWRATYRTRFMVIREFKSRQISVQAASGVVTLSGDVNSDVERNAAANDAGAIDGVRTVINNLQVQQAQVARPSQAEAPPQPEPKRTAREKKHTPKANTRHHRNPEPEQPASDATLANSLPPVAAPEPSQTPPVRQHRLLRRKK